MVNDDSLQTAPMDDHQEPPLAAALEEQDPALATPEAAAEGEAPLDAQATSARLVVKRNGAETDTEFPIYSPCVIGRFDPTVGPVDIDLANLPEGVYVSRKHAKISNESGVWTIEDLNSSNGTFVLGDDFERVEVAQIHDGQEIALGNARFVFHMQ